MITKMMGRALLFSSLFALMGVGTCDPEPDDGSLEDGSWDYGGSAWAFRIRLSFHVPAAEGSEFGDLVHSMSGEFSLPSEPSSAGMWYNVVDIIPDTEVRYNFLEWRSEDDFCEGRRGTSNITPAQEVMVQYGRLDSDGVMPVPLSNGDTTTPEHYFSLSFLYNDEYFESLTDFSSDLNGSFQYTCTYVTTGPDGAVTTSTVENGVAPPPVFVPALYAGALENGTDSWFVEGVDGASLVGVITLRCLSGCNPPPEQQEEEEEDECDEEAVQNECDDFKDKALEVCRQLEDWMLVESNAEGTSITCATSDCSGVSDAHQSSEPFTSVTYELDLACEESDYACSVECYGWGAL